MDTEDLYAWLSDQFNRDNLKTFKRNFDDEFIVLKLGDKFIKCKYFTDSYGGEVVIYEIEEVKVKTRTEIIYEFI